MNFPEPHATLLAALCGLALFLVGGVAYLVAETLLSVF